MFSLIASSAPSSVSHEVVNATAIRVSWSITGSVNGFVIYTISNGLDTVTKQLTDSSIREYVVDGLLPERNYTIAVRGYYQLLGPAGTTTARLQGTEYLHVSHAYNPLQIHSNKEDNLLCLVCILKKKVNQCFLLHYSWYQFYQWFSTVSQ